MIVSLIVAMDRRGGIGRDNQLPWRLSADLKRFRELTLGHHLLVGRKTYESIGRPLPGRQMIVVTRDAGFAAAGCAVVHSLEAGIALARSRDENELFIGGGAQIYAEAMKWANRIYLTAVAAEVVADVFFPTIDWTQWTEAESARHEADEKNDYTFVFRVLTRSQ